MLAKFHCISANSNQKQFKPLLPSIDCTANVTNSPKLVSADAEKGAGDVELVVQEHGHLVSIQSGLLDQAVAKRGKHR